MNPSPDWQRYESLTAEWALGQLTPHGYERLAELREQFDHAPSSYELASSAICLANIDVSSQISGGLRDQVMDRMKALISTQNENPGHE